MADKNRDTIAMPFGKHEGKDIFDVLQDKGYVAWLKAQPGILKDFRKKTPMAYAAMFGDVEPEELTPTHNKIQKRFLDNDFALAVLLSAYGHNKFYSDVASLLKHLKTGFERHNHANTGVEELCEIITREFIAPRFEMKNWDVYYDYVFFGWTKGSSHRIERPAVTVEIKPVMGEDFPSVMHQIDKNDRAMKTPLNMVLLLGSFEADSVTRDEMISMFRRNRVFIVFLEDVENLTASLCHQSYVRNVVEKALGALKPKANPDTTQEPSVV